MIITGHTLEDLNKINKDTLMSQLHIEYVEAKEGKVIAKMPVCSSTCQPEGILHGGASLALAETAAGLGSMLLIDIENFTVRGSQVSANHVGSISKGFVFAHANIVHKGKHTHVWNIDIKNTEGKLISTIRVTNIIVKKHERSA